MSKDNKVKPKPDKIDIHVGKVLKAKRILVGISQRHLAENIGVKFQQIQKYEKGQNRLSASRMYRASLALEIDINDFFEGLECYENAKNQNRTNPLLTMDKQTVQMLILFQKISNENVKKALLDLLKIYLKQE